MTSLEIPSSFINNLDVIVKHQNIQLIRAICNWKKWNAEELINEFVVSKEKKFKKSTLKVDSSKNNNKVEIRVREEWICSGEKYYVEKPHNNVYKDNIYIGRRVCDDIVEEYPEL